MSLTLPKQYEFLSRFYRLAIINIVSNITEPLAGLFSIAFLGHLTQIHHLAGVTISTTFFNCIYSLFIFLRMGTTGVTAIAVGQDDRENIVLVGLRNGLIALGIGLIILILQYPMQQLWFASMSASPEVKASGIAYFNARIWAAPAIFLNVVIIGWFLGREQSQKVLLMTVVANAANIGFDYLFIIRWDWASTGAGLSQTISQSLMLLAGIILVSQDVEWEEVRTAIGKLWDTQAFKAIFIINGDIFIRSLANMTAFFIFMSLSSMMGVTILAENALIVQVIMIGSFGIEGIKFTVETLSGNFKGKKAIEQLLPLLQMATGSSLAVALVLSGVSVLFPDTVFGLLTDHAEIIEKVKIHVFWLFSILGLSAFSNVLEGYFVGIAEPSALRNSALIKSIGFASSAGAAWYFQSNHMLFLAYSVFTLAEVVVLGVQLPGTLKESYATNVTTRLESSQVLEP
jgi:MATE family multidrug resistance protein